jgi:hypothetical protein
MMDYDDALESVVDGFVNSLMAKVPDVEMCNQDGYEVFFGVLKNELSLLRLRGITKTEVVLMVEQLKRVLERDDFDESLVVEAIRDGLIQWSGDGKMAHFQSKDEEA